MVQHADIDHTGVPGVPSAAPTYVRKTANQTSTSTSFADVTDLTFPVLANTNYRFRFVAFVVTSSAGEGYSLSVNGPAGTYKIGGILPTVSASPTGNQPLVGSGGAADTTGLTVSTGPAAAALALVEGVVQVGGAGGTLALRVKAETGGANSVTVQANSYGELSVL